MSLSRDPVTGAFVIRPSVTIAPSANAAAANTSAGSPITSFTSLSLSSGVAVTQQLSTSLGLTDVSPGVVVPSKAIVTNSTGAIVGVNRLTCASLKINGVTLDPNIYSSATSGSTDDLDNPYLQVTAGTAEAEKALVLNANREVSGIETIMVNRVVSGSREMSLPPGFFAGGLVDQKLPTLLNNNLTTALGTLTTENGWGSDQHVGSQSYGFGPIAFSKKLGLYVCVLYQYLMVSNDGIYWTALSPTTTSYVSVRWFDVTELFVAVGTNTIYTSVDGYTWSTTAIPHSLTTTNSLTDVAYCPRMNRYVVVGNKTNYVVDVLTDVQTWVSGDLHNLGFRSVVYAEFCDYFFALTTTGNMSTMRSRDGFVWTVCIDSYTQRTVASTSFPIAVSESLGIVVAGFETAINTFNFMKYTKNGVDWFTCGTGSNYRAINSVAWCDQLNMFIAGCSSSTLGYSLNGIEWLFFTPATTAITQNSVVYSESLDMVVARFGAVNMRTRSLGGRSTSSNFLDIDYLNGKMAIGGALVHPTAALSIVEATGNVIKFRDAREPYTASVSLVMQNSLSVVTMQAPVINLAVGVLNGVVLRNSQVPKLFWQLTQGKLNGSTPANNVPGKFAMSGANAMLEGALRCSSLTLNQTAVSPATLQAASDSSLPQRVGVAEDGKVMVHKSRKMTFPSLNLSQLRSNAARITVPPAPQSGQRVFSTDIMESRVQQSLNIRAAGDANNSFLALTLNGTSFAANDKGCFVAHLGVYFTIRGNGATYSVYHHHFGQVPVTRLPTFTVGTVSRVFYVPQLKRVYVAGSNNITMFSTDLVAWEKISYTSSARAFTSIAFSPSLNAMVAATTSGLSYSKDGKLFYLSMGDVSSTCAVIWSEEWGLFLAISSSMRVFFRSSDGMNWDSTALSANTANYNVNMTVNMAYSPKLQVVVILSTTAIYVCTDGKNIRAVLPQTSFPIVPTGVQWVEELEAFVIFTSTAGVAWAYSQDGFYWTVCANAASATLPGTGNSVAYNKSTGNICWNSSGAATPSIVYTSQMYESYTPTAVLCELENIKIDNVNKRVGVGKSPDYTLEIAVDSAHKPGTNSWATSSDERLKEDIQPADLAICRNIVDTIPLKHYKWSSVIQPRALEGQEGSQVAAVVMDKSQLGWIAQDVEPLLPKSVGSKPRLGLPDCKDLNSDQLIAHMWGALQSIQMDVEALIASR